MKEFRDEFNYERPHAALNNNFPSHLYRMSKREFPEKVEAVYYPTNMEVKQVSDLGRIYYERFSIFVSGALRGENIGLEEIDDRHYRMYFCDSIIGILDRFTGTVLQYRNPVPYLKDQLKSSTSCSYEKLGEVKKRKLARIR